jgi:hypothetical protein
MTIHDVIKWCDDKSQNDQKVTIHWEGGGDSGWVYLQVDGENTNSNEADWLIDKMHDELDYGSWAGEYSANGSAEYNPENKSFEGTDYYSEDDYATHTLNIPIYFKVPKKFYLENLILELEDIPSGGHVQLCSRMHVGFGNEALDTYLKDEVSPGILDNVIKAFDTELPEVEDSNWQTIIYDKDKVEEAGSHHPDHYLFKIEELEYRTYKTRENEVVMNLEEFADYLKDAEI